MLSPATRGSAIFLRTLHFPLHCRTPPQTAQPRLPNPRPLSTSRELLPSLEDLLKPRAKPKPDDTATTNPANTSPPPNPPTAQKNLFISGLPRGDAQELEHEIRAVFSPLGETPSIRVGAHPDGRKYAHLAYKSSAAALGVLRIVKETPVAIAERTLSVNLAGKSSEEPARSTLFFTGFHGSRDALKRALRAQGFKSFQVYFFLGSRAEQSGDGRIDFPSRVDTQHAYSKLNGMKIDDGATLNVSREPPGSPSPLPPPSSPAQPEPQPQPPAKTTLLVGNLPAQISETELGERVRGFFGRHAAIMSVELAVDDEGISQRFCYVRFVHPDEALRASQSAAEEPMVLDGLTTTAVLVPQPVLHRILHVRGFKGSRQSLKQALKKYSGRIKQVHFIHDRVTGKPTGNSLIEFKSKTGAVEALAELNGYEAEGGKLKLTFYKPTPGGFKHRTVKGEADVASGLKPI